MVSPRSALAAIGLLAFGACTADVATPMVGAPSLTYPQTQLVTSVFQVGNGGTPSVEWNGDVGVFSLAAPIDGVSIDPTSGTISWQGFLALGLHSVEAVATNSGGQTSVDVQLDNRFQGVFTGGINFDPESDVLDPEEWVVEYRPDGSAPTMARRAGQLTVDEVFTWTAEGDFITLDLALFAIVFHTEVTPTETGGGLEGFWYASGDVVQGLERGIVRLTWTAE